MKKPKKIPLMVNSVIPVPNYDRGGGEAHSLPGAIARNLVKEEIDLEVAKKNLEKCIASVNVLFSDIGVAALNGWEVDEVTFSIAISAEGSIGVVTAGVEGSIEVVLKPARN
ncbi:hypothetical protein [Chitinophaga sp. HK235]|uniref:Pepco domain-containing protein n=1 Tax=Chitinophaga sp. HK235 TaxID=2952571 RepID=UPI001BAA8FD7|nr:hypothetical protein [Chitinophaga sp. HK235]